MSQVIKAFLGVFLLLLIAGCGIGIFSTFLSVLQAQNLHAEIVNELEESAFHPSVMESCFEAAEEYGYDLSIELYEAGKLPYMVGQAKEIPQDTSVIDVAKVNLDFSLNLPLFGGGENHRLSAYAY